MADKRALVCSGGGAKGAFTAGVVYHLLEEEGLSFDIAVGTSTGSLVGGPALLGEADYLRNIYGGVATDDILDNSFLGFLVSIFMKGQVPINASMDPLYNLLYDYYITNGKLQQLLDLGKIFVVTSVNVRTGAIEYVSSEQVRDGSISRETYIRAILASASMPLFTKPIIIYENEAGHPLQKDLFFDGGVKEFLPVEYAVKLGATAVWGVSTHAPEFNESGHNSDDKPNLLKTLKWVLNSTLNEVERGDLFRAYSYLRVGQARKKIKQIASDANLEVGVTDQIVQAIDGLFPDLPDVIGNLFIISPSRPMSASLEFEPDEMYQYFINGRLDGRNYFAQAGAPQLFVDSGKFVINLG